MKKTRTSSILIPALLSLVLIVTVGFVGTSVYAEEGTAITNAEELKAMEIILQGTITSQTTSKSLRI